MCTIYWFSNGVTGWGSNQYSSLIALVILAPFARTPISRTPSNSSDHRHGFDNRQRSPSAIPSESWSECSLDDAHDPRSPPRMTANWTADGDDTAVRKNFTVTTAVVEGDDEGLAFVYIQPS